MPDREILQTVYLLLEMQGYYGNPFTSVTGTYELKNNQRGILSLSIINYAFSGDGPRNDLHKIINL